MIPTGMHGAGVVGVARTRAMDLALYDATRQQHRRVAREPRRTGHRDEGTHHKEIRVEGYTGQRGREDRACFKSEGSMGAQERVRKVKTREAPTRSSGSLHGTPWRGRRVASDVGMLVAP